MLHHAAFFFISLKRSLICDGWVIVATSLQHVPSPYPSMNSDATILEMYQMILNHLHWNCKHKRESIKEQGISDTNKSTPFPPVCTCQLTPMHSLLCQVWSPHRPAEETRTPLFRDLRPSSCVYIFPFLTCLQNHSHLHPTN